MVFFDVLVVGGGPAGSIAARELALAGARVLITDNVAQRKFKLGEHISPGCSRLIKSVGLDDGLSKVDQTVCSGFVSNWAGGSFTNDYNLNPYGQGVFVDRIGFDRFLLNEAQVAGAKTELGFRVRRCTRKSNYFSLSLDGVDCDLKARWIIDATGSVASIASKLGVKKCLHDQLLVNWWIVKTDERLKNGLGGIESCSSGWLYTAPLHNNRRLFAYFCDLEDRKSPLPLDEIHSGSLCRTELRGQFSTAPHRVGHAVVRSDFLTKAGGEGWLAVGDALISVDPLSSQGIQQAILSAINGSRVILEAESGNNAALVAYSELAHHAFAGYYKTRQEYYAQASRFHRTPFWEKRITGAITT